MTTTAVLHRIGRTAEHAGRLGAPAMDRAPQLKVRDGPRERRQPERERPVGEHGDHGQLGVDAERRRTRRSCRRRRRRSRPAAAACWPASRRSTTSRSRPWAARRRTRGSTPTARRCRTPTRRRHRADSDCASGRGRSPSECRVAAVAEAGSEAEREPLGPVPAGGPSPDQSGRCRCGSSREPEEQRDHHRAEDRGTPS